MTLILLYYNGKIIYFTTELLLSKLFHFYLQKFILNTPKRLCKVERDTTPIEFALDSDTDEEEIFEEQTCQVEVGR